MIKAIITSAAAVALTVGATAPAAARPYWGGHHHRGGGAIAIATSANKNKATPSRRGDDQRDDIRDSGEDAREVASMCSNAVENMARGPVSSVDSVGRDGPDGWKVDGVVRGERGDRHFFCAVREGQIETIDMGDRMATR